MRARLEAEPNATVLEHCAWWAEHRGQQLGAVTMWRALHGLGWTDKKKSLAASERNEEARTASRGVVAALDAPTWPIPPCAPPAVRWAASSAPAPASVWLRLSRHRRAFPAPCTPPLCRPPRPRLSAIRGAPTALPCLQNANAHPPDVCPCDLSHARDILVLPRGRSSAGRARQSHCRGQGFEPPRLHHMEPLHHRR